jgi:hypothetical protein
MLVVQGFSDVSGSEAGRDDQAIAAAGSVATGKDWVAFDQAWSQVLHDHGVVQFSMFALSHWRGEFRPWKGDETRRRGFLAALIAASRPFVLTGHAVGCEHRRSRS